MTIEQVHQVRLSRLLAQLQQQRRELGYCCAVTLADFENVHRDLTLLQDID